MKQLETICFSIITYAGVARSLSIEALRNLKQNKTDLAKENIKEANENMILAHKKHMKLITSEAQGKNNQITLLLVHAEDQIATAQVFIDLVNIELTE